MIHYHGLPITPQLTAVSAINAGHAFVSFAHPDQLGVAVSLCQSFAVDNGAFPAWKRNAPVQDWSSFYAWADECRHTPNCDFAVIPDIIDGDETENDKLLNEWPLGDMFGAPVWHMHESLHRLKRLMANYFRICIGSSAQYATVGNALWWTRIDQAMRVLCDARGRPRIKMHGLRMLNPKVFTKLPFTSADSTNIARNVNIDKNWANGNYLPPTPPARAQVMRIRIETFNSPATYEFKGTA